MTADRLGPRDEEGVRALLEQCGLPTADLAVSRPELLGWRDPAGLAGVVGVEALGETGLLRSLAVRPDQRGTGLGTRLTVEAERWAAQRGVRQLFLLTTSAAPFFARHGYAIVERALVPAEIRTTTEFATVCPSTAIVMQKLLPPITDP